MLAVAVLIGGCAAPSRDVERPETSVFPGKPLVRTGDEIVVCGQLFHTGSPVVLWTDPGGYDAYRTERRFVRLEDAPFKEGQKGPDTPNRYGLRKQGLDDETIERVRGGGWDLDTLRGVVDQFVLHYDVCGTSQKCFQVLHDMRGLSVHFMLDIDGTIYQTLDLKERAWHATIANDRSIGIEIANIGAYAPGDRRALDRWYETGPDGITRIIIPDYMGDGGIRTPGFQGVPERSVPARGVINGRELEQYDLTPEQWTSLINLTATLCTVFPKMSCDYPRGPDGELLPETMPREDFDAFGGILGHYHVQTNKVDPGPAMQWDRLINEARKRMRPDEM